MERRWAVCGGLFLALVVGAAIALSLLALALSRSSDADGCLAPIEELGLASSPTSRALPSLEVVPVDLPTMARVDDWRCWWSGPFPVRGAALEAEENVLWLAMDMTREQGLVRWDLDALEGTRVGLSATAWVRGVAVTGPGRLLVPGYDSVAFYDHGRWTMASGGLGGGPFTMSGVDRSGAVWLQSDPWYRCAGDAHDWSCASSNPRREPLVDHLQLCWPELRSLALVNYWHCVTRPRYETLVPLEPPACDGWRTFTGSRLCVTWDRDCSGQLVLLAQDPRRIERTLPWPGIGVDEVGWVTANERQVWLFAE